MKKIISTFIFILIGMTFSYAQSTIRSYISEQLDSTINGIEISSLSDNQIRLTWIDKLELRTQTDEFELDRQRYTARLSPVPFGLRKKQKALLKLLNNDRSIEFRKYNRTLRSIFAEEYLEKAIEFNKQSFIKKQLDLKNKKKKILSVLLQSDTKYITDYMDCENELMIDSIELVLVDKTLQGIPYEIISIDQIEKNLNKVMIYNYVDESLNDKQSILQLESEINNIKKYKTLDFLQLDYRGPNDNFLDERISFGLGIELPFSNARDLSDQKNKIEMNQLAEDKNFKFHLFKNNIASNVNELKQLIQKYQSMSEIIHKLQSRMDKFYTQIQGTSDKPLHKIDNEIKVLKYQVQNLNIYRDILLKYSRIIDNLDINEDELYLSFWY